MTKLEKVLQRIATAGLKINAETSFFGRQETEYLGFWITREANKVEAMVNIKTSKTRGNLKELHRSSQLLPRHVEKTFTLIDTTYATHQLQYSMEMDNRRTRSLRRYEKSTK